MDLSVGILQVAFFSSAAICFGTGLFLIYKAIRNHLRFHEWRAYLLALGIALTALGLNKFVYSKNITEFDETFMIISSMAVSLSLVAFVIMAVMRADSPVRSDRKEDRK